MHFAPLQDGRCTTEVSLHSTHKTDRGNEIQQWDVPGDDDLFSYFSDENIMMLATMNVFVVIYHDTVSSAYKMIRVAAALGKPIVLVRNKVDAAEPDEPDWREEIAKEEEMARKALGKEIPIFGVSARNALKNRIAAAAIGRDQELAGALVDAEPEFMWPEFLAKLRVTCDGVLEDLAQ